MVKESACNGEDPGLIPGSGRSPGEGNGNPLQYSYLEKPTGRGVFGYNPQGCKELDMTEQLHYYCVSGPQDKQFKQAMKVC